MWNAFPVIGHLISLLINISLAIPFWICWTLFGVGTKYFYFLPEPFHVISFWSCVGLFIVFGIANMGVDVNALEEAINAQVELFREEGMDEREFMKSRNMVETNFVTSNSQMSTIADNLAEYHIFYGDAGLINTEIERYMQVTPEDIMRVANTYLTEDNRVVLHYLPKTEK